MPSQKTFAELYSQMLELVEFFKRSYSESVEARAVLVRAGTNDRIAPEEIVGTATLIVNADAFGITFIPSDENHATFTVGVGNNGVPYLAEPALLGMNSEDIVFRLPDFPDLYVLEGTQVQLLAKPDRS